MSNVSQEELVQLLLFGLTSLGVALSQRTPQQESRRRRLMLIIICEWLGLIGGEGEAAA
jgi:hypothetical protein